MNCNCCIDCNEITISFDLGQMDLVKLLVENYANINEIGKSKKTALIIAVQYGNRKIDKTRLMSII